MYTQTNRMFRLFEPKEGKVSVCNVEIKTHLQCLRT